MSNEAKNNGPSIVHDRTEEAQGLPLGESWAGGVLGETLTQPEEAEEGGEQTRQVVRRRSGGAGRVETIVHGDQVDHFKIIRLIGRGGMGQVYLARDTRLGRKVALKVIHESRVRSRRTVEKFLREARITARFNHPHIVSIYAVGVHEGQPYVALEYLEGQTLRGRISEGSLSPQETVRIGLAIAEALREAHRSGILHRDLKPTNVLIPKDGRVRVLDFGLAVTMATVDEPEPEAQAAQAAPDEQHRQAAPDEQASTAGKGRRMPKIQGTPSYMSPEQWREEPNTAATDIWSLGLILHELATGHHPYAGCTVEELLIRVAGADPVPLLWPGQLYDVPPDLAEIISRCLSKSPGQRPDAAEVVELLDQVLEGRRRSRVVEGQSPFRGLLPFSEAHTDFFFGRETEIDAFQERLREKASLAVVGPSGTGKSSFIQAGVIPRLKEQGTWTVLRLRPGSQPFSVLASRLLQETTLSSALEHGSLVESAGPGRPPGPVDLPAPPELQRAERRHVLEQQLRQTPSLLSLLLATLAEEHQGHVLLFVDQMEELYTLVAEEEVRCGFTEAIFGAADAPGDPVRVVFTVRDDFLFRIAETTEAWGTVGGVVMLRGPDGRMLEEMLVRPLQVVGYRFDDPSLAQEMIEAVQQELSCLPLLEFAARALWERRDPRRRLLCRSAYEEIGGVAGALAHHADAVLGSLSPAERELARRVLLRLVTAEGTRQVLGQSRALEGLQGAAPVLDHLIRARLITVRRSQNPGQEEPDLELAHESLISTWKRLSRWIDESKEELRTLAEVDQAAELWARRGHRDEEVWGGAALAEAMRTLKRVPGENPAHIVRFLQAGQQREWRRIRRRRLRLASLVGLLSLVAVGALAVALVLSQQNREVTRQRAAAEKRRAEVQQEAARAALEREERLEARARLRAALEVQDSTTARLLWRRLSGSPLLWRRGLGANVFVVDCSPDGRLVAAACADRSVYVLDTQTRAVHTVLRGHADQVFAVAFSPDGHQLVSGDWKGEVWLWELASGRGRTLPDGHAGAVWSVAFGPRGRLVSSAGEDGTVRLWSTKSQAQLQRLVHPAAVWSLAISPSGKVLACGIHDGAVWLWDVRTGRQMRVLKGHEGSVNSLAYAPDGRLLASGGRDQSVRLWDASTGKLVRVLTGHGAVVWGLSFSPDSRRLASGGLDKTVRLWDVATGQPLGVLVGHSGTVWGVSFAPDGRHLATGSVDQTVRMWDLKHLRQSREHEGHTAPVNGLSFSPDGRHLATAGRDRSVRLWEVSTGRQVKVIRGNPAPIYDIAFTPDGKSLVTAVADKTLRVWDVRTAQQKKVLTGHMAGISGLSVSPDGQLVASGSDDSSVSLWDLQTGRQRQVLRGHTDSVIAVAFSPDGRRLASGGKDRRVRLWQVTTGRLLRGLPGHEGAIWGVAFSPDGQALVSTAEDGTVRLWDLSTGQGTVVGRHPGRVYRLSFHPDGRQLGVPGSDGTARIWDVRTRSYRVLAGHRAEVNAMAFSPDGRLAGTVSDDGTVRLWETARPYWRATLLAGASGSNEVDLSTHRGWLRLRFETGSGGLLAAPPSGTWRQAVVQRARLADLSPDGQLLCLGTFEDRMEVWDLQANLRLAERGEPEMEQVVALPGGCAVLARNRARLHGRSGEPSLILQDRPGRTTALAHDGQGLLMAVGKWVFSFGAKGRPRTLMEVGEGATALARCGAWLVVGYENGNLERFSLRAGRREAGFAFEDSPSMAVERMLPGPGGTVIAGHANGEVGIWDLRSGRRLEHGRVHGPVIHLMLRGQRLYVASELGSHLVLDLSVLYRSHCSLLREIWQEVPVVWEGGLPVPRAPPAGHRCLGATDLFSDRP